MMPQKRHPDMLELIRGRCGTVYGDLFAVMTTLKGCRSATTATSQKISGSFSGGYDTVSSCRPACVPPPLGWAGGVPLTERSGSQARRVTATASRPGQPPAG